MPRDPRLYLDDIIDAASSIQEYTKGYSYEGFVKDKRTQDAVVRNLEIIGEAAGRLPRSLRSHAESIEWRKIIDLRNILIHEYFGVSIPIIWDIVQNKLKPLQVACEKILDRIQND